MSDTKTIIVILFSVARPFHPKKGVWNPARKFKADSELNLQLSYIIKYITYLKSFVNARKNLRNYCESD